MARRSNPRGADRPADDASPAAAGLSPSQAKDAAARAALVPLAPGERPGAVTVAAVVAMVLALANLGGYLLGPELGAGRARPPAAGVVTYSALLLALAGGLWRAWYWAVLIFQLGLVALILLFSLLALKAESLLEVLLAVGVIGGAGTLFTFLVKAMARIQMPRGT